MYINTIRKGNSFINSAMLLALPVFILYVCLANTVEAKIVPPGNARRIAEHVLGKTSLIDRSAELPARVSGTMYLFSPSDSIGFVLVSADDCALPVIGYSLTSRYRANVSPVEAWLVSGATQINQMRQNGVEASSEVSLSWEGWLNGTPSDAKTTPIAPLVTSTWNQSAIYQLLTPYDSNAQMNCYNGCGAVAMAQIMRYWGYPNTGRGSHSYNAAGYGTLSADFDTTYDWSLMPDALTSSSTDQEIDAVNLILYHVGVSIDMAYSPSGSSSYVYHSNYTDGYSIERSMPTFFKYSSSIHNVTMSEYTRSEWRSLMMNEIREHRPVVYRGGSSDGGGHIFILDGCDIHGDFHFNWGWGGYGDGYFAIGSLNPGGSEWNEGNCAVIGIMPKDNEESSVTCTAVPNESGRGTVSGGGSFDAYSATIRLLATSKQGYRFSHWNDGCINNPRYFPACESRTDTAIFVPVKGDTMGYCSHRLRNGWGYYNPTPTWGATCLPKSDLTPGGSIAAVELYSKAAGTYTINICSGNVSSPGEIIFTQTFYVDSANQMVTLQFDSLVKYSVDKPLWLVMQTNEISYPIPMCRYSGWNKSCYVSYDGSIWRDTHDKNAWMSIIMRGIFVNPEPVSIDPVDGNDLGMRVLVDGRRLTVNVEENEDVSLYDINGRLLSTSRGQLDYYAPSTGVYIIRKGNKTRKIVLK